jgi:RNA polymerase primary sigma factor
MERIRVEFCAAVEEISRQTRRTQQMRLKLMATPRGTKPKQYRTLRWQLGRALVKISRDIRKAGLAPATYRLLANRLRQAVDELRPVEKEIARLQRAVEDAAAVSSPQLKDLRRDLRAASQRLPDLEQSFGASAADGGRTR